MATRLERVIVDLDDRFTRPAARMAVTTRALAKSMDSADKSAVRFNRSNTDLSKSVDYVATRISVLSHVASTLGPALIPVTTAAVPAVAGLANQLGFAAVAGGTAIVAFQGVGDALKALNEAQLDPSEANLAKLREEMAKLGPAGRDFVRELQALRPQLQGLQDIAQEGLFPGLTEGIDTLMQRFPEVERIIGVVSKTMGELAERGAEAIAGPGWDDWFAMLESEAKPTLEDIGVTVGNFTKGLAELWMAFMPLSRDFGSGLREMSAGFAEWADGLAGTEGFQEFVEYIRTTAPDVLQTLGSLTMMLVDLGTAFAPVGDVALKALTAFAEAISAIASSDIGPTLAIALAGFRAYSLAATIAARSSQAFAASQAGMVGSLERQKTAIGGLRSDWAAYTAVQQSAQGRAQASAAQIIAQRDAAERLKGTLRSTAAQVGKTGAAVGGLAVLTTGAADGFGLTNTASLALMGTMAGPFGAAIGGTIGLLVDSASAANEAGEALDRYNAALAAGDATALSSSLVGVKSQLDDLRDLGGLGDILQTIGQDVGFTFTGKTRQGEIRKYEAAVRGAAAEQDKLSESARRANRSAGRIEGYDRQANAVRQSREAARQASQAFVGLGDSLDDGKTSLRGWLRELEQQARATQNFADNVRKAARRGLDEGLIKSLHEAGPAGAMRLQQLANSAGREIPRANKAFRNGQRAANDLTKAVSDVPAARATKFTETGARNTQDAARRVGREMNAIPSQRNTNVKVSGAQQAREAASSVIAALNGIPLFRNITVTTRYRGVRVGSASTATDRGALGMMYLPGGVKAFAQGGFGDVADNHQPELYRGGVTRVWGEPETQGEAYIPLANDGRRPRARAIAEETVALLGGVAYFADGGRTGPTRHALVTDSGVRDSGPQATLRRWRDALERSRETLEKERAARQSLIERRDTLKGTVRDAFRSDLFAQPSNIWAAGAGDPLSILRSDISNASAFKTQIAKLRKAGVSGDALASIAATGDLNKATSLAGMSGADLKAFQTLYDRRAAVTGSVGAYAGDAAYRAAIAEQTKEARRARIATQRLEATVKRYEKNAAKRAKAAGRETGRAVNSAAAAARRKKRGKS